MRSAARPLLLTLLATASVDAVTMPVALRHCSSMIMSLPRSGISMKVESTILGEQDAADDVTEAQGSRSLMGSVLVATASLAGKAALTAVEALGEGGKEAVRERTQRAEDREREIDEEERRRRRAIGEKVTMVAGIATAAAVEPVSLLLVGAAAAADRQASAAAIQKRRAKEIASLEPKAAEHPAMAEGADDEAGGDRIPPAPGGRTHASAAEAQAEPFKPPLKKWVPTSDIMRPHFVNAASRQLRPAGLSPAGLSPAERRPQR